MTTSPLADATAHGDADLARAAASGDRTAFAAIYDRYADRLYDFCLGMMRDRDAAADCVQDVFVTATTKLAQLREKERLRPWLYAIARNHALARIQHRRREYLTEEPPEMASNTAGLDTLAARNELAALIDDACGGLSERDRTVFELAYRHGLDGPELADALGVSHTNANTLVGRLRDTVERSLGALLVARRARSVPNACPELVALLADWDGRFTVLMRKRIGRHIDNCSTCDDQRRRMVNPVALLGGAPVFVSAPAWLRQSTLSRYPSAIANCAASAAPGGPNTAAAQHSWWPPRSFDTSDLGMQPDTGPANISHHPTGPTPEPLKIGPKFPGGRSRTALLVALVLLALGTVAVLGTVLAHQLWPPGGPAQTPTPAPAGANLPIPAAPAPPAVTPVPPPVTSIPAPPPPSTPRPATREPATTEFTPPSSTPARPLPVTPTPTPTPTPTVVTLPPPPPVFPVPVPNPGAGGQSVPAPGDSTVSSGGSPQQVPNSSGGSSAGGATSPSAGSSGGSSPPITHKLFGGSGPNSANCPVLTGCPTVPNNHGIH
jgi:RNA polymerase sigma factor (sigma-70 family)